MTTRAFLLAFFPMCAVLAASFVAINRQVKQKVKTGLADSLNQTGSVLSSTGPEYNRRYGQLLTVLGEHPTLEALLRLLQEASSHPTGDRSRIRIAIERELRGLSKEFEYDFWGIADSMGTSVVGCFRGDDDEDERVLCLDSASALASKAPNCFNCHTIPATNVIEMEDTLYNIAYVPLRQGNEIQGSLTVGTRNGIRSLANFIHTVVLDRDSYEILLTTFYPQQVAEIERQFQTACRDNEIDGCEITVDGKSYLALQPEGVSLPGNSVMFTFQSIDAATSNFMRGFGQDFLLTAVGGGFVVLLLSVAASRSLSKPLRDLVANLKYSERTGKLASNFATNSQTEEVNLLAAALNRAGEAVQRTHKELEALTGRVISAKEEESKRLARELHDAFSQKLAILSMEVSALQREAALVSPSFGEKLQQMAKDVGKLAKDVHQLSRQLHPAILDDLGLSATLRAECRNFSQQHGIPTKFLPADVPESLPSAIALSVYRIAQESLWNIAKHAQAQEVRLTISTADGELFMTVEDDGMGFDHDGKPRGGLGMVSMEERARLAGGTFAIHSNPGNGTRVEVRIPLPHAEGAGAA